jgi:hypothetical protein
VKCATNIAFCLKNGPHRAAGLSNPAVPNQKLKDNFKEKLKIGGFDNPPDSYRDSN